MCRLYAKALIGRGRKALEIYRRVDTVTKGHGWVSPTAEETLTVALNSIAPEAWRSAKLLRVPD